MSWKERFENELASMILAKLRELPLAKKKRVLELRYRDLEVEYDYYIDDTGAPTFRIKIYKLGISGPLPIEFRNLVLVFEYCPKMIYIEYRWKRPLKTVKKALEKLFEILSE